STDNVPPSTFTFNYVDPTLPYVESVKRFDGMTLVEGGRNEITELPTTLTVVTDNKTKRVNVYLGNYTTNSAVTSTLVNPDTVSIPGKHVFTYSIPSDIANGLTKITFIPSTDAPPDPVPAGYIGTKAGENYSGRRRSEERRVGKEW